MRNYLIVLCFIGGLWGCEEPAKEAPTVVEEDPIVTAMHVHADTLLMDSLLTAVSIGIYKDGKTYIQHYGELDEGKGNAPTDNTLYEIASVSKTMTGTLVAQAVQDGKLKLDDDIRIFLEGDYPNLAYHNQPITIQHLITHTSRLPYFLPERLQALFVNMDETLPFRMTEIQKTYSKAEFLEDLHTVVLDTVPGVRYAYSNVGPELVALALEKVYNQPFETLLQTYVFGPANMTHSKIRLSDAEQGQLVNGYGETRLLVPHLVNPLWGAAGGVKSTIPDLVNYMQFQLDKKSAVVQASHNSLYEEGNVAIGHYWRIHTDDIDGTYYGHHGGTPGMQNWFFIIPQHNIGISIATNQSDRYTAGKLATTVNAILDDIR